MRPTCATLTRAPQVAPLVPAVGLREPRGGADDALDGHAELGTALQEVEEDMSGVTVAQAPGRRRVHRLLFHC